MPVQFICPECYQEITADENMAGEEATCPTCDTTLKVPTSPGEGTVSLGGYVLEKCLGEGRMGLVYRATQSSMNRVCALKILAPDLTENEQYIRRFVEEVRLNAQIEHPHVVKFYDVGEAEGRIYAAMSYIEGTDLGTRLKEHGPLDDAEALDIAHTVAKTLKYVWEQHELLGLNINPYNIFIDRHDSVKLMNLGVTRHQGESPDAAASLNKATIAYMSPEQTTGKELDSRSDIYSLGATLYHLLTGKLPQAEGEALVPPREHRDTISEQADQLIQAMVERDPDKRHQDWDELIGDLERAKAGKRPYRMPGGALLTDENLREESRNKLSLRRDADDDDASSAASDDDEGIITTAAAAEAEARNAVTDTPTQAETRDLHGDTKEAQKTSTGKKVMRYVLLILAMFLGFKYGFGPILAALQKKQAAVFVVNDSDEQRYMLRLGWRMIRRELFPAGVVKFELNVGMSEKQGLVVWEIDEEGNRKKIKKIKVPLDPTARVLVNLNQAHTYYIFEPDKAKGETLSGLETLGNEILRKAKQLTAPETIINDAVAAGKLALVDETDAEVIDLRQYQSRAGRVGYSVEQGEEAEGLPILTDQAQTIPISNGSVSYNGAEPEAATVNATLPVTGTINVWSGADVELKNPRATIARNSDGVITVTLNAGSMEMREGSVTVRGNWAFRATRRPGQAWEWRWHYNGTNQQQGRVATHRMTIVVPNQGQPEKTFEELKR